MTVKGLGRDPIEFDAHYLDNGWNDTFGDNGAPIKCLLGNGITSHDLEAQSRDSKMFCAHYLKNGWRFRLGCN